jgi:outer membrane protein assembly factor BamE (lipoprotein component of BamABCDE complex)
MKHSKLTIIFATFLVTLTLTACTSNDSKTQKETPKPKVPKTQYTSDADNQFVKKTLAELNEKINLGMDVDDVLNDLKDKYTWREIPDITDESFDRGYAFFIAPKKVSLDFKVGQTYDGKKITKIEDDKLWVKGLKDPVSAKDNILLELNHATYHFFLECNAKVVLYVFTPQRPEKGWEDKIGRIQYTYQYGNVRNVHMNVYTRYFNQINLEEFKY